MNIEEDKKPFKLLIVGTGKDLSPRMKINVATLLGKHPEMEIEYKDVSSPDVLVVQENDSVFNNMKLKSHPYYSTKDGFNPKLNTKPYYRQKERY